MQATTRQHPLTIDSRLAFSYAEAGELIGGLHRNRVADLVNRGELKAKAISVRGTGRPKKVVPRGALIRFLRALPDVAPKEQSATPAAREASAPADASLPKSDRRRKIRRPQDEEQWDDDQ